MGQIKSKHLELFSREFGKIAKTDFVYTLSCTTIKHSAPNLVEMYVSIRAQMSLIMDIMGPELSELFALELAKIAESDFVYSLASINVDHLVQNMVTKYINMVTKYI